MRNDDGSTPSMSILFVSFHPPPIHPPLSSLLLSSLSPLLHRRNPDSLFTSVMLLLNRLTNNNIKKNLALPLQTLCIKYWQNLYIYGMTKLAKEILRTSEMSIKCAAYNRGTTFTQG